MNAAVEAFLNKAREIMAKTLIQYRHKHLLSCASHRTNSNVTTSMVKSSDRAAGAEEGGLGFTPVAHYRGRGDIRPLEREGSRGQPTG